MFCCCREAEDLGSGSCRKLINQMVVETAASHRIAIAEIDQTFKEFGIASGSPARGGKAGQGEGQRMTDTAARHHRREDRRQERIAKKSVQQAAAPKAPKAAKAPKPRRLPRAPKGSQGPEGSQSSEGPQEATKPSRKGSRTIRDHGVISSSSGDLSFRRRLGPKGTPQAPGVEWSSWQG